MAYIDRHGNIHSSIPGNKPLALGYPTVPRAIPTYAPTSNDAMKIAEYAPDAIKKLPLNVKYLSNSTNPYAYNSLADVTMNIEAQHRRWKDTVLDPKKFTGILLYPVRTLIDSVLLTKDTVLDPIVDSVRLANSNKADAFTFGDGLWQGLKTAGFNTLVNIGNTADIVANPVKGAIIESIWGSGNPFEGFQRGLYGDARGRKQYDYADYTDSKVGSFVAELVSDPLNLISFGTKTGISSAAKAGAATTKNVGQTIVDTLSKGVTKEVKDETIENISKTVTKHITKKYTGKLPKETIDKLIKETVENTPIATKKVTSFILDDGSDAVTTLIKNIQDTTGKTISRKNIEYLLNTLTPNGTLDKELLNSIPDILYDESNRILKTVAKDPKLLSPAEKSLAKDLLGIPTRAKLPDDLGESIYKTFSTGKKNRQAALLLNNKSTYAPAVQQLAAESLKDLTIKDLPTLARYSKIYNLSENAQRLLLNAALQTSGVYLPFKGAFRGLKLSYNKIHNKHLEKYIRDGIVNDLDWLKKTTGISIDLNKFTDVDTEQYNKSLKELIEQITTDPETLETITKRIITEEDAEHLAGFINRLQKYADSAHTTQAANKAKLKPLTVEQPFKTADESLLNDYQDIQRLVKDPETIENDVLYPLEQLKDLLNIETKFSGGESIYNSPGSSATFSFSGFEDELKEVDELIHTLHESIDTDLTSADAKALYNLYDEVYFNLHKYTLSFVSPENKVLYEDLLTKLPATQDTAEYVRSGMFNPWTLREHKLIVYNQTILKRYLIDSIIYPDKKLTPALFELMQHWTDDKQVILNSLNVLPTLIQNPELKPAIESFENTLDRITAFRDLDLKIENYFQQENIPKDYITAFKDELLMYAQTSHSFDDDKIYDTLKEIFDKASLYISQRNTAPSSAQEKVIARILANPPASLSAEDLAVLKKNFKRAHDGFIDIHNWRLAYLKAQPELAEQLRILSKDDSVPIFDFDIETTDIVAKRYSEIYQLAYMQIKSNGDSTGFEKLIRIKVTSTPSETLLTTAFNAASEEEIIALGKNVTPEEWFKSVYINCDHPFYSTGVWEPAVTLREAEQQFFDDIMSTGSNELPILAGQNVRNFDMQFLKREDYSNRLKGYMDTAVKQKRYFDTYELMYDNFLNKLPDDVIHNYITDLTAIIKGSTFGSYNSHLNKAFRSLVTVDDIHAMSIIKNSVMKSTPNIEDIEGISIYDPEVLLKDIPKEEISEARNIAATLQELHYGDTRLELETALNTSDIFNLKNIQTELFKVAIYVRNNVELTAAQRKAIDSDIYSLTDMYNYINDLIVQHTLGTSKYSITDAAQHIINQDHPIISDLKLIDKLNNFYFNDDLVTKMTNDIIKGNVNNINELNYTFNYIVHLLKDSGRNSGEVFAEFIKSTRDLTQQSERFINFKSKLGNTLSTNTIVDNISKDIVKGNVNSVNKLNYMFNYIIHLIKTEGYTSPTLSSFIKETRKLSKQSEQLLFFNIKDSDIINLTKNKLPKIDKEYIKQLEITLNLFNDTVKTISNKNKYVTQLKNTVQLFNQVVEKIDEAYQTEFNRYAKTYLNVFDDLCRVVTKINDTFKTKTTKQVKSLATVTYGEFAYPLEQVVSEVVDVYNTYNKKLRGQDILYAVSKREEPLTYYKHLHDAGILASETADNIMALTFSGTDIQDPIFVNPKGFFDYRLENSFDLDLLLQKTKRSYSSLNKDLVPNLWLARLSRMNKAVEAKVQNIPINYLTANVDDAVEYLTTLQQLYYNTQKAYANPKQFTKLPTLPRGVQLPFIDCINLNKVPDAAHKVGLALYYSSLLKAQFHNKATLTKLDSYLAPYFNALESGVKTKKQIQYKLNTGITKFKKDVAKKYIKALTTEDIAFLTMTYDHTFSLDKGILNLKYQQDISTAEKYLPNDLINLQRQLDTADRIAASAKRDAEGNYVSIYNTFNPNSEEIMSVLNSKANTPDEVLNFIQDNNVNNNLITALSQARATSFNAGVQLQQDINKVFNISDIEHKSELVKQTYALEELYATTAQEHFLNGVDAPQRFIEESQYCAGRKIIAVDMPQDFKNFREAGISVSEPYLLKFGNTRKFLYKFEVPADKVQMVFTLKHQINTEGLETLKKLNITIVEKPIVEDGQTIYKYYLNGAKDLAEDYYNPKVIQPSDVAPELNELQQKCRQHTAAYVKDMYYSDGSVINKAMLENIDVYFSPNTNVGIPVDVLNSLGWFSEPRANNVIIGTYNIQHVFNKNACANMFNRDAYNLVTHVNKYTDAVDLYLNMLCNDFNGLKTASYLNNPGADEALYQALKNNKDFDVLYIRPSTKYSQTPSGVVVEKVTLTSVKDLQLARKLNAHIVPSTATYNIMHAVNEFKLPPILNVVRNVGMFFKVGYLSSLGWLAHNFIDSNYKNHIDCMQVQTIPKQLNDFTNTFKVVLNYNHIIKSLGHVIENISEYNTLYKLCTAESIDTFLKEIDDTGSLRLKHYANKLIKQLSEQDIADISKHLIDPELFNLVDLFIKNGPSAGITVNVSKFVEGGTGFSQEITDWWTQKSAFKYIFNANEIVEQTARLQSYLYSLQSGRTINEAIAQVIKTHFDYSDKSLVMMYTELLFPFMSFSFKNLEYWLEKIYSSGFVTAELEDLFKSILNMNSLFVPDEEVYNNYDYAFNYNKALKSSDPSQPWQMVNAARLYHILAGNVVWDTHKRVKKLNPYAKEGEDPYRDNELYHVFKLSPSVLDAAKMLNTPIEQFEQRLLPPYKAAINIFKKVLIDGEDIDVNKEMAIASVLNHLPYIGAVLQRSGLTSQNGNNVLNRIKDDDLRQALMSLYTAAYVPIKKHNTWYGDNNEYLSKLPAYPKKYYTKGGFRPNYYSIRKYQDPYQTKVPRYKIESLAHSPYYKDNYKKSKAQSLRNTYYSSLTYNSLTDNLLKKRVLDKHHFTY